MIKDTEEAINFYLEKKQNENVQLSEIKTELKDVHQFSEKDVKYISREIIDRELESIDQKPSPILNFFNQIIFSYIMAVAALLVIIYSAFFIYLEYEFEPETYFDRMQLWPFVFISGGVLLYGKHHVRIKRSKRKN